MKDQSLVKTRIDLDKRPEQVSNLRYDFFRDHKRDVQLKKSEIPCTFTSRVRYSTFSGVASDAGACCPCARRLTEPGQTSIHL